MAIADFDELNVLWVAEMDLPVVEKLLRVQMMTEFEERIRKFFGKQKETAESGLSTEKILLIIGLLTVPLAQEWRVVCDKYYTKYVSLISTASGKAYPTAEEWQKQHSVDFARWVQETTGESLNSDYVFSDERARDIARTEVNGMCDLATLDGFYRSGYTHKRWDSFHDSKVRQSHRKADGQIKLLAEPFEVGDSLLMFPHDTSLGASASETVNCRCVMSAVQQEGEIT
jgi:hypothetical protein